MAIQRRADLRQIASDYGYYMMPSGTSLAYTIARVNRDIFSKTGEIKGCAARSQLRFMFEYNPSVDGQRERS